MKVLFVGNVLDVVFMDNTRITVTDATDQMYNELLQLHDNEEKAKELMLPHFKEEMEAYEEAISFEKRVTQYPELKRYGDVYIFHQISDVSVPKSIVEAFVTAKEEKDTDRVEALLNFWTMCCTVEDSRVRNNIFWYCEKYGIKLTKYGQLKLYRNVVIKEQGTVVTKTKEIPATETEPVKNEEVSTDLTQFISSEFIRVRTKAKKNPAHFTVILNGNNELISSKNEGVVNAATTVYGNLKELYEGLSSENKPAKAPKPQPKEKVVEEVKATTYTDAYTRKMEIRIGKMVTMPRELCDHKQEHTCSSGLHCASKDWLQKQGKNYLGDGRQSLLVLVNPRDIVAIPPVDGYGKLRVCAYLPVKALSWNGNTIEDDTFDDILEGEFFENISTENSTVVQSDDLAEKYIFSIPKMPDINIDKMSKRLDTIKHSIKSKKLS